MINTAGISTATRSWVAALVLVALPLAAQAQEEDIFLSNQSDPTALLEVDLDNNEVIFLTNFTADASVHGITICAQDENTVVAVGKEAATVSTIDLGSMTETVLGNLPDEFLNQVVQLACSPDGVWFLTNAGTDQLYTLDPATCPVCAPVLIGPLVSAESGSVDTDGADIQFTGFGELFLVTNVGATPSLWSLDPNTAIADLVGAMATANITGMTQTLDGRMIVSSNDDHFYEVSTVDASVVDLGTFTEGQEDFDIHTGDLGARFGCVMQIDLRNRQVAPGEDLRWDLYLRHFRPETATRAFTIEIQTLDQTVVTSETSRFFTLEHLDEVSASRKTRVPLSLERGIYRLVVSIDGMRQGRIARTATFFVE